MELRELRYFVTVAETGHVGRAADRLFIAQPSLSYAIKQLERDLKVTLFRRHRAGVDLTPAGRELLPAARRALRAAERMRAIADALASGAKGRLLLGFEASGAGTVLTRIRGRFTREHPDVVLELRRYDWGGEVPAIRNGEIDVAVVWQPNDVTGLRTLPLTTEERYIGLPVGHPLAGREHLTLADIADIPLGWTREAPRSWVDWWAVNPRPDGSPVRWGRENHNVEEMLEFAAAGEGACISPASMTAYYARPDLRWVPLHGLEPLRIDLAWDPDRADAPVRAFVETARAELESGTGA